MRQTTCSTQQTTCNTQQTTCNMRQTTCSMQQWVDRRDILAGRCSLALAYRLSLRPLDDDTMPRDTTMPRDRFAMHWAESLGATRATECAATKLTLLRLWLRMPTTFRCAPRVPCHRCMALLTGRSVGSCCCSARRRVRSLSRSARCRQRTNGPVAHPGPAARAHAQAQGRMRPMNVRLRATGLYLQYLGGPVELREALYLLWVCAAFFTAGGQRLLR
jgi:hypothetical protein